MTRRMRDARARRAQLANENRWPYLRLDGSLSVKQRQPLVDTFNDPTHPSFLFLLSSKAGGVGLNIIGANRLVLFDPGTLSGDSRRTREPARRRRHRTARPDVCGPLLAVPAAGAQTGTPPTTCRPWRASGARARRSACGSTACSRRARSRKRCATCGVAGSCGPVCSLTRGDRRGDERAYAPAGADLPTPAHEGGPLQVHRGRQRCAEPAVQQRGAARALQGERGRGARDASQRGTVVATRARGADAVASRR